MQTGYTHHVIKGFGWQTALKVLANGIALLKIMALARLLTPDDFGLFSLVLISLGVMESLTQTGVNTTILQSKHSVEYFLNTAWVIAIIRGLIISTLMIMVGFAMARFYQQPQLLFLVAVASLIPAVKGFINPMIVAMHKQLAFFADTGYRLSLIVVDALFSVAFVWLFDSVFGWILGLLAAAIFEVAISFLFFTLKPRFEYLSSRAALIFAQAKSFAVSGVLSYLNENIDNLLIGKIVGSYGLGIYQQAYGLSHELNYELAKSANHGSLPVYTRIKHDPVRLQTAFTRTSLITLALMITASLPLLLVPQLVVDVIFGEQWQAAVPLMPWLGLAGILQGVLALCHNLLIARSALRPVNWQLAATFVIQVGSLLYFGQRYGLMGAVAAVIVSRALLIPYLGWRVATNLKGNA